MSEPNPYEVGASGSRVHPGAVDVVAVLSSTRPWVVGVAVVGALSTTCLGLVAFVSGIAGIASSAATELGAAGGVMLGGLSLIYLLVAATYALPTWFLFRYAGAIRSVTREPSTEHLAEALVQQQRFWQTTGILALLVLGLYVLAIVAVLAAGIVSL